MQLDELVCSTLIENCDGDDAPFISEVENHLGSPQCNLQTSGQRPLSAPSTVSSSAVSSLFFLMSMPSSTTQFIVKTSLNRQRQQRLQHFRSLAQVRSTAQSRTTATTTTTAIRRDRRTPLLPTRRSLRLYRSHPRRHRSWLTCSHSCLFRDSELGSVVDCHLVSLTTVTLPVTSAPDLFLQLGGWFINFSATGPNNVQNIRSVMTNVHSTSPTRVVHVHYFTSQRRTAIL